MGRPREFGTNSPGRRELRKIDEMYRRRLKEGKVTALFPQDIAKQLDRAGLHMIDDLRSKELVDIYCALPGTGPAEFRKILEKVGRVERNSDLWSAYRKARSIRKDPGHNNAHSWSESKPYENLDSKRKSERLTALEGSRR